MSHADIELAETIINEVTDPAQLERLQHQLAQRLAKVRKDAKAEAIAECQRIAASVGMTVAKLVAHTATTAKREAKYVHPTDASLGWSGRGRRPTWVKEWEDSGRLLTDIEVKQAT